jgi:DNA-binding NarL/FixJ family response regulator
MEKLSVARDWLARTETRLEKVGKQAEEQLKLLESLVKEEVSHVKKDRGAPSMDKRQTVTKLARQGWSAEEIARATKLSRGEVELILELISDKVER